jgi:endo-1,4-beta-xylanase
MRLFIVVFVLQMLFISHAQNSEVIPLREYATRANIRIGASGDPFNIWADDRYTPTANQYLNSFTPENTAKWCVVSPQEGVYDFSGMDEMMAFAQANNLMVHGHVLVWHICLPDWLLAKTPTRDEAIELMRNHITTMMTRYKGQIASWDVVNEAFLERGQRREDSFWERWIGSDFIEIAFRIAHEVDPDALLFYNDFSAEATNAKADAIYAMVQDFVARGVPIDGVGFQSHIMVGEVGVARAIDTLDLQANFARYEALGIVVKITEIDVSHHGELTADLARMQAGTYYQMMQACVNAPNCIGFTTWDLRDTDSWLREPAYFDNPQNAPLLFDDNFQPKLALIAITDVLARKLGEEPLLSDEEVQALFDFRSLNVVDVSAPDYTTPQQLSPNSVNGLRYYAPFAVPITLDGDISDWQNIPQDRLLFTPDIVPTSAVNFSVSADEAFIYVMLQVQDAQLTETDRVMLYFNFTDEFALEAYQQGVVQFIIPALNPQAISGTDAQGYGLQVESQNTADGYTLEIAFPLDNSQWGIQLWDWREIGFEVQAQTDENTRWNWSLSDTQLLSDTQPKFFAQVLFWQAGR